jgi:hypothetical protein
MEQAPPYAQARQQLKSCSLARDTKKRSLAHAKRKPKSMILLDKVQLCTP